MTNDVLERRYGATRTRRWPVVAAASVLTVVALAWITWVVIDGDSPLSYQLSSYDVVSDTETVVSIELNREDGAAVECEIYAQSDDHSIVGERLVTVPPGESGTIRVDEPIKTERRAVNGVLRTCRLAG